MGLAFFILLCLHPAFLLPYNSKQLTCHTSTNQTQSYLTLARCPPIISLSLFIHIFPAFPPRRSEQYAWCHLIHFTAPITPWAITLKVISEEPTWAQGHEAKTKAGPILDSKTARGVLIKSHTHTQNAVVPVEMKQAPRLVLWFHKIFPDVKRGTV